MRGCVTFKVLGVFTICLIQYDPVQTLHSKMKRFIYIALALLSWSANAQRVLKHTLIPSGRGGDEVMVCKITDYQLLVNCNAGGVDHNIVFFSAEGDTIQSQYKRMDADYLIKVNNSGVFLALNINAGFNVLKGLTFDSNGTQMGAFRHIIGDPLIIAQLYYADSYTDSLGNVVLHLYTSQGGNTKVYHVTLNPFGQLVKVKDYGFASPVTFYGALSYNASKLIVKDGKLWGFTTLTNEGVIGWGIDTAGLTGQSYFLLKSRNIPLNRGTMTMFLPYKKNGYFVRASRSGFTKVSKSDVMGEPIALDSQAFVNTNFYDIWASSDSSRVLVRWPPNVDRILRRVDHLGNVMGEITLRSDTFYNTRGFFCFGDGSWINISQNPAFGSSGTFPYMLTRISDIGYPYDPWRQQVVFKGVTGTVPPKKELPKIIAYPNPTSDNIRFMGIAEGNIILSDFTGKTVLNSKLTAEGIYLSHLPKGMYYYQLHYRNQVFTGKIVRE